jgi:hypothetical protein
MPKLSARVDNLEAVDQKYRDLYTKDDETGGFVLDAEGIEDVSALKSALKKEREGNADAKTLAKAFKEQFPDKTPKEIADLVKAAEKAGAKGKGKGEDDEDVQRLLKKREDELRAEFEPISKKAEELAAKLRRGALESAADAALDLAKVMPDRKAAARQLILAHLDIGDDEKVFVKDEDGDPSSIAPAKFAGSKFKETHPYFFQGSGASGSGANQGGKGSGAQDTAKMTPTDKITAGLQQRANGG